MLGSGPRGRKKKPAAELIRDGLHFVWRWSASIPCKTDCKRRDVRLRREHRRRPAQGAGEGEQMDEGRRIYAKG
jgi:hypothetical protein